MIPITVFYDPVICSSKDIIKDYMKDVPIEYQTKDFYGEPVYMKYGGQIRFHDLVILFVPLTQDTRGMKVKIAFVPEHIKETNKQFIDTDIIPIMYSSLLGYYDQKQIGAIE